MAEEKYRATEKGKAWLKFNSIDEIKTLLSDPSTKDQGLLVAGEWIKSTCIFFGSSPQTAYLVAAEFVRGLNRDF